MQVVNETKISNILRSWAHAFKVITDDGWWDELAEINVVCELHKRKEWVAGLHRYWRCAKLPCSLLLSDQAPLWHWWRRISGHTTHTRIIDTEDPSDQRLVDDESVSTEDMISQLVCPKQCWWCWLMHCSLISALISEKEKIFTNDVRNHGLLSLEILDLAHQLEKYFSKYWWI